MSLSDVFMWLREAQHYFSDLIVTHLQTLKDGPTLTAYAGLISVGFLYGALHAIGPGHGKVVVSGYILAHENSLKRGLWVVGLSSLLQSITAISLVLGFYYVLDATRVEAERWAALLETASFVMIATIGAYLILQGLASLFKAIKAKSKLSSPALLEMHHDAPCGCGHAHAPTAKELETTSTIGALAAMIVSIGIRPCTGALLLLFFSCMFGLVGPGILATIALGLGTATTTGALAILAVTSKKFALSFIQKSDRGLLLAHAAMRLGGGALILLMALIFLIAQHGGEAMPNNVQHPLYKALP